MRPGSPRGSRAGGGGGSTTPWRPGTVRALSALFVGGIALAAAFPKLDYHLLVWVAIVPLLLLVRGTTPVRAFLYGVFYGAVFRAATLYWVVYAMTRFGGLPLVAAIAGAGALVLYLACYWGLFALVVRRVDPTRGSSLLLVAVIWAGLEYLQSWLFTGFPWSLVGYAAGASSILVQVADLGGVYLLGFLAVAVNFGLAAALLYGRAARVPALIAVGLLIAALGYGAFRLLGPLPGRAVGEPLVVAVVQGNVQQDLKWDVASRQATIDRHLRLSAEGAQQGADLVFWAESSWPDPYGVERDVEAGRRLAELAVERQTALLVGTVHLYEVESRYEVTNAAVLIDDRGQWRGRYEKSHLVPFGEYLPLQRYLRFLGPLVQAVGSLRAGSSDQPLLQAADRGVPPFGLAICYEVIFPAHAARAARGGARFLATITNDAWYGTTSGPFQHFAMARFRAVETRRTLVRAANTGISGIIDARGRVHQRTELEQEALVVGSIELREGQTLYTRTGDAFASVSLLIAVLALVSTARRRPTWLLPAAGSRG